MKKIVVWKNDRGLTLVEILAALVILGIVFVGFMTVFPQMTNFNEKTETKLKSMNEARIFLDEFKTSNYLYSDFEEGNEFENKGNYWIKIKASEAGFSATYKINKTPDLQSDGLAGQVNLHQIHIVINKNGDKKSETFGYIEVADE